MTEAGRRIRVMQVIDSMHIGGAENAVVLLARGLDRARFDVCVRCTNGLGVLAEQLQSESIDVAMAGVGRQSKWRYFTPWFLRKAIRAWRPDVVHSHGTPGLLHTGPLAAIGAAPPWVHTFHYGNYPLANAREMRLERMFARYASQLVAVADVQKQSIVKHHRFSPDALVTVINGVDPNRMVSDPAVRDARRAEFGFTPDHVVVGCIAVMTRQKGIPHLLQAAREVLAGDARVRFLIVGGGPLEASLRQEAAGLGLDPARVVFTGWRQDNLALLSALDVFVMSSLWEAMPLALLEAMAARRPIVVTDVGDNRMVVEDGACGLVVPPAQPEAIVAAVRRILGDPAAAAAMAERAHARFAARFTTRQMVGNYEAIYARVSASRLATG